MIIIIAVTGIGSFATVDYALSWTYRILRVAFIFLASLLGYYGIAIGIFLYSVYLGKQRSFGIDFLSPMPKNNSRNMNPPLFVNAIWKREKRPKFLNTKNPDEEPKISQKWKTKNR
jgi:spore germination protein KA